MRKLINLLRSKKVKEIQEGDMVYGRIPLGSFTGFHLFKVVKVEADSADVESKGITIQNVSLDDLKRSDFFNEN